MKHRILALASLLLLWLPIMAAEVDSTRFVIVSLLTMGPGPEVYSVFGHNALRMQCPSKGLDYAFTFEMEPGLIGTLKFFSGQCKAGFVAVPTAEFVAQYKREGRSVVEDEINLTPTEKRELWRALDEDMVQGPHRQFNLLQNNCTSMSMLMVESIMMNEEIDYGRLPYLMLHQDELLKSLTEGNKWAQFIFCTLIGTEIDATWPTEQLLSPRMVVSILRKAQIVNHVSGQRRPVMVGKQQIVNRQTASLDDTPIMPVLVFSILLALVLVISLAERFRKGSAFWQKAGRATDVTLFTFQSICGIALLYITLVSGLFGLHWNWYLIPFNPLPLVFWLLWRKRDAAFWRKMYGFYALVLLAFMVITPWITSQQDLAHELLVATLMVRCLNHGLRRLH